MFEENKHLTVGKRYKFLLTTFGDVIMTGVFQEFVNETRVSFTDVRRENGSRLVPTRDNSNNTVSVDFNDILCYVEDDEDTDTL